MAADRSMQAGPAWDNVADYLLEGPRQAQRAQATYLLAAGRAWTFGELEERVQRAGSALLALGVRPGERVLFSVVDGIDFPTLFLAIMKIGAVAVPVNTYLKPHDYRHFLLDSEAVVAVVDR